MIPAPRVAADDLAQLAELPVVARPAEPVRESRAQAIVWSAVGAVLGSSVVGGLVLGVLHYLP